MDSTCVFLAGHGTSDGNSVSWKVGTNSYYNISNNNYFSEGRNISGYSFLNPKLVIVSACYGGLANGIANTFELNGADASIGWKKVVDDTTLSDYTSYLTEFLGNGETIRNSILNTNKIMLDKCFESSSVFSYQTYGNVYNTILGNGTKTYGTKENGENVWENTENHYYINTDIEYNYKEDNDIEIIKYIKENIDNKFEENNFQKTVMEVLPGYENSDLILTYRYKVNDILSDFGYSIIINNGKAKEIKMHGQKLYEYNNKTAIYYDDYSEEKIREYVNKCDNSDDLIKDQVIERYFDSETLSIKTDILTTYEDDNGSIYCTRNRI